MPIYQLERKQNVGWSLDHCWRFVSDLRKITPPEMNFRIKRDLPPAVYPGLMIEYTVSPLFGIPITWLTEIVHVDAPNRFVDEQRTWPYRIWHHKHFLSELPGGGTEVRDLVTYAPPLGPLGILLNRFLIRPQLDKIFNYRESQMARAGAAPPA